MAGIGPTGFEIKTFEQIRSEMDSDFRGAFGAGIDTSGHSVFGQIINIMAERFSDLWQAALGVFSSAYRDSANGVALDNLGDLIEVERNPSTNTQVFVVFAGDPLVSIPIGTIVKSTRGDEFKTQQVGSVGTPVECVAIQPGAKPGFAGTITQIITPISGITAVNNPTDHIYLGTDQETDTSYRRRQQEFVTSLGKCTTGAIRRKILDVANVTDCYVFENEQPITSPDGLPPHSFECVVLGGNNQDIGNAIVNNKPCGIASYGSVAVSVTDANAFNRTMLFSRPALVPVHIVWTIRVDLSKFPSTGQTLIKNAIVQYGLDTYRVGSEVRGSALSQVLWALNIGVKEFELPLIGIAPNPIASTTLQMSFRQKPVLDSSRITLNIISAPGDL